MPKYDNYLAFLFNLEKQQLFQEICFRRFRRLEQTLIVFLMISVLVLILEENYFFEANYFNGSLQHYNNLQIPIEPYEPSSSQFLRIFNVILTSIMLFLLYHRKKAFFIFMKSIKLIEISKLFHSSSVFLELLVEMSLISIQTYPNILGWAHLPQRQWVIAFLDDTVLTFIGVIIRMIFILRCLIMMSKYSSPKSMKICFEHGVKAGAIFTLKSEFCNHLKTFATAFLILSIFTYGVLLRLSERSAQMFSHLDWDYIWNSFWCIIVTMTTVGYGDFLPTTDFGRVIVGLASLLGSLITSMVCIIFMIEIGFSKSQENAYERIKATECNLKLRHAAGKCVTLAGRYYLRKKKANHEEIFYLNDEFHVDIKKNVKDFVAWKKIIVDFKFNRKLDKRLAGISDDLNERLDELGVIITYTDFIKTKIDTYIQNQKELIKSLEIMENFHLSMSEQLQSFSNDNLDAFKEFKSYFSKKNDRSFLDDDEKRLSIKIPSLQLNKMNSNFTEFSSKRERSSLLKQSKNDEKKFLQIVANIERNPSLKKRRKSVFSETPQLKNIESMSKQLEDIDSETYLKKNSISSKKKEKNDKFKKPNNLDLSNNLIPSFEWGSMNCSPFLDSNIKFLEELKSNIIVEERSKKSSIT